MKDTIANERVCYCCMKGYDAPSMCPVCYAKKAQYLKKLERDNALLHDYKKWYRQAEMSEIALKRDNALLREVAKASVMMWNGGWDKEHQREIENIYSAALKAAEAAMGGG